MPGDAHPTLDDVQPARNVEKYWRKGVQPMLNGEKYWLNGVQPRWTVKSIG